MLRGENKHFIPMLPPLCKVSSRVGTRGVSTSHSESLGGGGGSPPLAFANTKVKSKLNPETCYQGWLYLFVSLLYCTVSSELFTNFRLPPYYLTRTNATVCRSRLFICFWFGDVLEIEKSFVFVCSLGEEPS